MGSGGSTSPKQSTSKKRNKSSEATIIKDEFSERLKMLLALTGSKEHQQANKGGNTISYISKNIINSDANVLYKQYKDKSQPK